LLRILRLAVVLLARHLEDRQMRISLNWTTLVCNENGDECEVKMLRSMERGDEEEEELIQVMMLVTKAWSGSLP
jgi:hypothetical protein